MSFSPAKEVSLGCLAVPAKYTNRWAGAIVAPMAKPRIFISSTFYDLRQVRDDLSRFVREFGYEPVMHEQGAVPYASDRLLEDSCYREIEQCQMVIALVGGRFGTESKHVPYSISQRELKKALDCSKQVFIFVEKSVHAEFTFYKTNKGAPFAKEIKYASASDRRVYEFLEEIESLPINNATFSFETARDVQDILREQWAGLMQRMLEQLGRKREVELVESMHATAKTLDDLVAFLTKERTNKDDAIQSILLMNHPAFEQLRKLTQTPYRIIFATREEMSTWLRVRNFTEVNGAFDSDLSLWTRIAESPTISTSYNLTISDRLFAEDGKLRIFTATDWDPGLITMHVTESPKRLESPPSEDDIPF